MMLGSSKIPRSKARPISDSDRLQSPNMYFFRLPGPPLFVESCDLDSPKTRLLSFSPVGLRQGRQGKGRCYVGLSKPDLLSQPSVRPLLLGAKRHACARTDAQHTDVQTYRHRRTHMHVYATDSRQAGRQAGGQAGRHADSQTDGDRDRDKDRDRDRGRDRDRDRQTETETDRHDGQTEATDLHAHTDNNIEAYRHTQA